MENDYNISFNRLVIVIFASLLLICTCNIAKAQIIANTEQLITIQLPATGNPKIIKYNDNLIDDIWLLPSIGHQLPLSNLATAFLEKPSKPQRFYVLEELEYVDRGALISSELRETYIPFITNLLLFSQNINMTLDYTVECYRLTYLTVDPWGRPIKASGSLFVPSGVSNASLAMYQHGTILKKADAPSNKLNFLENISPNLDLSFSEAGIGVMAAGKGCVATLPDYLGMGSGDGYHPYVHARSEATAAIDLARAANQFLGKGFIKFNKTFVFGYSQGGHAAVALNRELQLYHSDEFNVLACAAGAGPYSMSEIMFEDLMSGRPHPNPFYFPYVLEGYNKVYNFDSDYSEVYKEDYINRLPKLVDGSITGNKANEQIPEVFIDVLKEEFLAKIRKDKKHWLHQILENNDVTNWVPNNPLRLYHGSDDKNIIIDNAYYARDLFLREGAQNVEVIEPIPNGNHYTSAMPFFTQALGWFMSFK